MSFKLTTIKNTMSSKNVTKPTTLQTVIGAIYTNNLTTGLLELAGIATTGSQLLYRANEAVAVADAKATANMTIVSPDDEYLVDTVNNTNVAHNGQRMIVTATGLTVTNTGVDAPAGPFIQIAPVGVAADKKIIAIKQ